MKPMLLVFVAAIGIAAAAGCGGPLDESAPVEKTASALSPVFQTVPGHNTAVESAIYSCQGWSYRLLFSLEQHPDPSSPTGWYAAVGPSSPTLTGTSTTLVNGDVTDVSADVYLQCYFGFLPATSGTFEDGRTFDNRLYQEDLQGRIICSLTTVWPKSWHAQNPSIYVEAIQYDWVPSVNGASPGGVLYLDLHGDDAPAPGNGWCGHGWYGGGIPIVPKFPVPTPPPVYTCTGDSYVDFILHGGCVKAPPDCTIPGNAPCMTPINL